MLGKGCHKILVRINPQERVKTRILETNGHVITSLSLRGLWRDHKQTDPRPDQNILKGVMEG